MRGTLFVIITKMATGHSRQEKTQISILSYFYFIFCNLKSKHCSNFAPKNFLPITERESTKNITINQLIQNQTSMKKLFLMLSLMMTGTAMMAQWTEPTHPVLPTPEFSQVVTDGETVQYFYNVEAKGFLLGANDWNTRTSVSAKKGFQMKVEENGEGENGLTTYYLRDYDEAHNAWNSIDCDGDLNCWVDGGGRAGDGMWNIVPAGDLTFYLTHEAVADQKWGVEKNLSNSRCFFNTDETKYGNVWAAVSAEAYEAFIADEEAFAAYDAQMVEYDSLMVQYKAAVALKNAIDNAKELYEGIDLSAQEAIYNAGTATAEELNATQESIKEVISEYVDSHIDFATIDKPMEITETIPYLLPGSDTELNTYWTREWTGNGTVGTFHMNTWSTEGNSDGTEMRTPFIEDWVGKGNILSNQKYYRNAQKVRPGVYKIMAKIRTYNESQGATENSGAYLYANNSRKALLEQTEGSLSGYYNGMLFYANDNFETYTIVTEDSLLTFGIMIENANFNWVAAKDFRIYFCGASLESYNYARENSDLMAPKYDLEEVYGEKALLTAYNQAYDAYENATTAEEINAAYKLLGEQADAVQASVLAYTTYAELVNGYVAGISSGEYDYNGDLWAEFCDYVQSEMENTIEKGELDAESIDAKATALKKQFEEAVKASISEGDDCTSMLTNPSFKDGFNGWTKADGSKPNGNENCGLDICKNVEVYENTVDVQQTINDVPDGIYAISCQAFERPAGNGGYDGSETSKVYLFMNDFKTPVQNICKDAMPEETAENQVNCYSGEGTGAWPYDYNVDGYGWVPNSVDGASYAFAAGRYVQTTYGLVEGGKMTIGLTSNGVKAHWVLWANFKLTYAGKTPEAVSAVLESILPNIEEYYENCTADNLITDPAAQALNAAISEAQNAMNGEDGEAMFQTLVALNKAYAAAQENEIAVASIQNIYDVLGSETLDMIDEIESDEYTTLYEEYDEIISDELYLEYTTEELNAFVEKVNAFIKTVADAHIVWEAEQVYEEIADLISDASDEEPVDLTDYIVNASLDNGNADGWTLNMISAANCQYQGASYSRQGEDEDDYTSISGFLESWRSTGDGVCVQADIYQSLMLPAGTYKLGADMIASKQNDATAEVTGVYLYAGDNDLAISTGNGLPEHFDLIFKLTEEKNLIKIGFRSEEGGNANWIAADNFTLEAYGAKSNINPTAIENIATEAKKNIFTLTGVRITKANKPGLYIINGKKMVVK